MNNEFKIKTLFQYYEELKQVISSSDKPPTLLQNISNNLFKEDDFTLNLFSARELGFKYYFIHGAIGHLVAKFPHFSEKEKANILNFFDIYHKESQMFELFYEQKIKLEIEKEKTYLENNVFPLFEEKQKKSSFKI